MPNESYGILDYYANGGQWPQRSPSSILDAYINGGAAARPVAAVTAGPGFGKGGLPPDAVNDLVFRPGDASANPVLLAAQRANQTPGQQKQQFPNATNNFQPPGGFPLQQNIQQGLDRSVWNPLDWWWFKNQVQTGAPWDYKNHGGTPDQGNFNYGAVGTAMGIPQQILDRAAGFMQGRDHPDQNPKPPGHWYGSAPYGDNQHSQDEINAGIDYERRRQR